VRFPGSGRQPFGVVDRQRDMTWNWTSNPAGANEAPGLTRPECPSSALDPTDRADVRNRWRILAITAAILAGLAADSSPSAATQGAPASTSPLESPCLSPPPNFTALTATPVELSEYGLPRRPPGSTRGAIASWVTAVDHSKHRVCSATTAAPQGGPGTLSFGRNSVGTTKAGSGLVRGKEVLDTTIQLVSGLEILSRVGNRAWHRTLRVRRRVFAAQVRPGCYLLTEEDGRAVCKDVKVTVRTKHTAFVTITCDGMYVWRWDPTSSASLSPTSH